MIIGAFESSRYHDFSKLSYDHLIFSLSILTKVHIVNHLLNTDPTLINYWHKMVLKDAELNMELENIWEIWKLLVGRYHEFSNFSYTYLFHLKLDTRKVYLKNRLLYTVPIHEFRITLCFKSADLHEDLEILFTYIGRYFNSKCFIGKCFKAEFPYLLSRINSEITEIGNLSIICYTNWQIGR